MALPQMAGSDVHGKIPDSTEISAASKIRKSCAKGGPPRRREKVHAQVLKPPVRLRDRGDGACEVFGSRAIACRTLPDAATVLRAGENVGELALIPPVDIVAHLTLRALQTKWSRASSKSATDTDAGIGPLALARLFLRGELLGRCETSADILGRASRPSPSTWRANPALRPFSACLFCTHSAPRARGSKV
jgi:hypothetical protein